MHDVAIQRLPVRFALDRAGLVGADGPTHAGSFDLAYLGCLPGFVLMAAADEAELVHMVATQVAIDDRPSALRYPRGDGVGVDMPEIGVPLEIGKGRIVREGTSVALLSFGTRLAECLKAADMLASHGLSTTVADARFAKPLDVELVLRLAREHDVLITVEEGAIGGFGTLVLQTLAEHGASIAGSRCARWSCRICSSIRTARRRCTQGRTRCQRDSGEGVRGARKGHRRCARRVDPRAGRAAMKVLLSQPRGFCAGVVRAIEIVERALEKYGPPVYVRHEIVHNKFVVDGLKAKGAIFVEELSEVPRAPSPSSAPTAWPRAW